MNAQLENWDDIRYFLAVARAGSLNAAAAVLRVNHSTVFRRIRALEESLATRLFERHPTGYQLTQAGEEMIAIAARVEEDVLSLDRRVIGRDRQLTGTVRMTAVEEIVTLLAPELHRFALEYPGIDLEIISDQRLLSLARREADVAIRSGPPPDEPGIVGKRLVPASGGFYASRTYLDTHGVPQNLDEFREHAFVAPTLEHTQMRTTRWFRDNVPNGRFVYRSNTMLGQLSGVRAGFGIGILPCFLCDRDAELMRLRVPEYAWKSGVWLLVHSDLRQTARVRAFIDWITAEMQALSALFAGELSRWSDE